MRSFSLRGFLVFVLFYLVTLPSVAHEQYTVGTDKNSNVTDADTSDSASWRIFSKYFPTNDPTTTRGTKCPQGLCYGIAWHIRLLNSDKVAYDPSAAPETVFSLRQKLEKAAHGENITLNGVAHAGDVAKQFPTTIKGSIEETQAYHMLQAAEVNPEYFKQQSHLKTEVTDRNKELVNKLQSTLAAPVQGTSPLFYIFNEKTNAGHVMNVNKVHRNSDGTFTITAQDRNHNDGMSEGSNQYIYRVSKDGKVTTAPNSPQLPGGVQYGLLDYDIPGEPQKEYPGWLEMFEKKKQTLTTAFPEREGSRGTVENPLLKISPVYGNSGSNTAVRDLVNHLAKDINVNPKNVYFDSKSSTYRLRTNDGKMYTVVPQDIVRQVKDSNGKVDSNWTAGLQLRPDVANGQKQESIYVEYALKDGKLTQERETFRLNSEGEIESFATHKQLKDSPSINPSVAGAAPTQTGKQNPNTTPTVTPYNRLASGYNSGGGVPPHAPSNF